MSKQVK